MNHQYANMVLNGTSWGVMDIEEHISDTFLEKQKKRVIIIRFANEDIWLCNFKIKIITITTNYLTQIYL